MYRAGVRYKCASEAAGGGLGSAVIIWAKILGLVGRMLRAFLGSEAEAKYAVLNANRVVK